MNEPARNPEASTLVSRLVARVFERFGHDLRVRLGAMVNFATLLEEGAAADPARELAGRLRVNALDAANLWTALADAMEAAAQSQARRPERGDPATLLRAIASELGIATAQAPAGEAIELECDRPILAFALRAFLEFERSVRPSPGLAVDVRIEQDGRGPCIEISSGRDGGAAPSAVTLEDFTGSSRVKAASARSFALRIAAVLVEESGGAIEFAGVPGQLSRMRLRPAPRR